MLLQSRKSTRKWLTLFFVTGFLLNVQAGYACVMMPDMTSEQTECCCGTSHRMPSPPEPMEDMSHSGHDSEQHHGQDQVHDCGDPLARCCIVEVSVGINDPPSDDPDAVDRTATKTPNKLPKQVDLSTLLESSCQLDFVRAGHQLVHSAIPPDPYLHFKQTPLYKTTARYRI